MNKGVLKLTTCFLAAGIAFTGTGTSALAAKNETLAGSGSAEESDSQKSVKEIMEELQAERISSADSEGSGASGESDAAGDQGGQAVDTSLNGTLAFAQCDEYINIRTSAGTDGEVVGKIYNNGSATILGKVGDWYEVQTGNVTGYVNADYFAVGAEADAIAQQVAYNVATVHPEALMVRSEPDEDSEAVGVARNSDQLEVVAYEGDWMKVALGGDSYGYVNAYYVDYDTYYATGETLEEEQERLDAQWLAYLDEQRQAEEAYEAQLAAERAAAEADYAAADGGYQDTSAGAEYTDYYEEPVSDGSAWTDGSENWDASGSGDGSENWDAGGSASEAQAAADAAYQNYLDAQAAADAATQQADEQLVYDTAAAAEAAYQEYLNAQNTADQAAAGGYQDTSADAGYTDYYEEPVSDGQTWTDGSGDGSESWDASGSASEAQTAADAAYQSYLDAQAAADAATQQADEQLVYDTAAAAEAAYQEYLNAQNAADQAAAGMDYTDGQDQTADAGYENYYEEPADQTWSDGSGYEETYEDDYTDEGSYEDGSSSEYQEEPQYTESYTSGGGQAIVDFALQFVGNPYVWGGTSLTGGADCSGFTQSVFANFGIGIPRTAASQSGSGTPVDLGSIQPGDLLFYEGGGGIGHVSIYMGGGQVVHASNSSTGIIVSDYGYRTPVCARRYW